MGLPILEQAKWDVLRRGIVIPAHPLALTAERRLDERHQRALSRYYLASGAGGLAVAVHTTQFAIREPRFGLHRPVLELAAEAAREQSRPGGVAADRPIVLVAGVVGRTEQALVEAVMAGDLGYDAVLLQLGAFGDAPDDELVAHCERVAEVLPLFGFYLQPAVGGRRLGRDFWRRFAAIPNVVAIKVAPFDRYATLDVMLGVAGSGRAREIALYTGNDDAIIADLLFRLETLDTSGQPLGDALRGRAAGALGGLDEQGGRGAGAGAARLSGRRVRALGAARVGMAYDRCERCDLRPRARFAGCIPGIHEVLRRQGLLAGRWTLAEDEELSPGQLAEIDRVCAAYPELTDDDFVAAHLEEWLA